VETQKFTVVIPTMWRCRNLFLYFLNELEKCDNIGEIIIINNDINSTPKYLPNCNKIRIFNFKKNIYVNPAWNFGVSMSKHELICIANDDILFDVRVFEKVADILHKGGVVGISPGIEQFGQVPITTGSIDIIPHTNQNTFGFGCLMFIHKKHWRLIPQGLNIYFGDNFIFEYQMHRGNTNYHITNMYHYTPYACTTSDKSITGNIIDSELELYEKIKQNKFER